MTDLASAVTEAVRTVLAETGAAAPDRDTDTLSGLITTAALTAAKEYAAAHIDAAEAVTGEPVPNSDELRQIVAEEVRAALAEHAPAPLGDAGGAVPPV